MSLFIKNRKPSKNVDLKTLRWNCVEHLFKNRRQIVADWAKSLRQELELPSATNVFDPATSALQYKKLDNIYIRLVSAIRDGDYQALPALFVANHYEVLDHKKSLTPLLIKISNLANIVRNSLVKSSRIDVVAALYYIDKLFGKITTESVLLFGEKRRLAIRSLTNRYRQEKELAFAIFKSCPLGLMITDREGYITHVNKAQTKIYGKSQDAYLGKKIFSEEGKNSAEFKKSFEKAIYHGEVSYFKGRYVAQNSSKRCVDVCLGPIKDQHERILGVVQVTQDVTSKADLEQKMYDQNHAIATRLKELEEAYNYIGKINRQFSSLVDINNTISSKISLDKMLDFIVRSASMLTQARLTTLRLCRGEFLDLIANFGMDNFSEKYKRIPIRKSLIGRVLHENRQILIVDLDQDRTIFIKEVKEKMGLKNLISVALRSRGTIIGVLSIYLTEKREFTSHEQNFLIALANQAAMAIDLEKALSNARSAHPVTNKTKLTSHAQVWP